MKAQFFTLLFCLFAFFSHAQEAGTLDGNFNKTGIKVFDVLPNVSSVVNATITQPDGKILVAGSTNMYIDREGFVARFLPNGDFDSTFHYDGIVTIDMSNEDWDAFEEISLRPDGKILLAGNTMDGGDKDLLIVQLMPDGSLDPNFGALGVIKKDMGNQGEDAPNELAILPDGKFLVAGNTYGGQTDQFTFVLRFKANGDLDKSFANNGIYMWDEADNVYIRELVVLPNGKIILGCQTSDIDGHRLTLKGLTEDGETDNAFGFGGTVSPALTTSQADLIVTMLLSNDNKKIIVCGRTSGSSQDIFIARFSITGGIDVQFGNGGFTVTDLTIGGDELPTSATLQPDGKILITGSALNKVYVARFQDDGTLDHSFNQIGYWIYDLNPGSSDTPKQIKFGNGKAYVVGNIYKANKFVPYALSFNLGETSTGTSPQMERQIIQAYPNPSSSKFNIELDANEEVFTYKAFDLRGRLILQENGRGASITIDASGWAAGAYLLQVEQRSGIFQGTIIKQ